MGVIAESIVAYAQPLLDGSDGSVDGMQHALTLAQVCWNLALLSEKEREAELAELRPSFHMNDGEFEAFRRSVVLPMIERHQEMFPNMPRFGATNHSASRSVPHTNPATPARTEKYPETGRNAPCPCHSGKKYKRCCGQ